MKQRIQKMNSVSLQNWTEYSKISGWMLNRSRANHAVGAAGSIVSAVRTTIQDARQKSRACRRAYAAAGGKPAAISDPARHESSGGRYASGIGSVRGVS